MLLVTSLWNTLTPVDIAVRIQAAIVSDISCHAFLRHFSTITTHLSKLYLDHMAVTSLTRHDVSCHRAVCLKRPSNHQSSASLAHCAWNQLFSNQGPVMLKICPRLDVVMTSSIPVKLPSVANQSFPMINQCITITYVCFIANFQYHIISWLLRVGCSK